MRAQHETRRKLGGGGAEGRGGGGSNARSRPALGCSCPCRARGLNGLGDYLVDTAMGFAPSGFDVALGLGALVVIGAAFVVPALVKE